MTDPLNGARWDIRQGDCLDLLRSLPDGCIDAVIAAPPYGIKQGTTGGERSNVAKALPRRAIKGDNKPFDPAPWLGFPIVCLFGANHYADKLPASSGWILWDKREGGTSDNYSDGEVAWTNQKRPLRIFSHLWRGMIRASEKDTPAEHPTQKPVAVMEWVIETLQLPPGSLILDPYCGSGSTGVAAMRLGMRFLGFELEPDYCAIARRRIAEAAAQEALPLFDTTPTPKDAGQGDLFAEATDAL